LRARGTDGQLEPGTVAHVELVGVGVEPHLVVGTRIIRPDEDLIAAAVAYLGQSSTQVEVGASR
jgi:hypothetical protein